MKKKRKKNKNHRRKRSYKQKRFTRPAILVGTGYPWFELTDPWCVGTITMYKDQNSAHNEVNLNVAGIKSNKRYRLFLEEYD